MSKGEEPGEEVLAAMKLLRKEGYEVKTEKNIYWIIECPVVLYGAKGTISYHMRRCRNSEFDDHRKGRKAKIDLSLLDWISLDDKVSNSNAYQPPDYSKINGATCAVDGCNNPLGAFNKHFCRNHKDMIMNDEEGIDEKL